MYPMMGVVLQCTSLGPTKWCQYASVANKTDRPGAEIFKSSYLWQMTTRPIQGLWLSWVCESTCESFCEVWIYRAICFFFVLKTSVIFNLSSVLLSHGLMFYVDSRLDIFFCAKFSSIFTRLVPCDSTWRFIAFSHPLTHTRLIK